MTVFRLLVKTGPGGMAAGDIARAVGMPPNTLTANLNLLAQAGLVQSRRDGRHIIYAAAIGRMAGLMNYLLADCCEGQPSVCAPLIETVFLAGKPARPRSGVFVMPTDRPINVLFLCTGNSARSILAEAILNAAGAGRFRAFSAGSHPKSAVHPDALGLLERLGHPTSDLRSKSWDEFATPAAPDLDAVITVCDNAAGEVCPFWPGQPVTAHWGIPDPAAATGSPAEIALTFADAYRMLDRRIGILVNLPVETLEKQVLKRRLDDIVDMTEAAKEPVV